MHSLAIILVFLVISNSLLVISWYLSRDINSYKLIHSSLSNIDKHFSGRVILKFLKYFIIPPRTLLPVMIIIQPILEEYVFRYVPVIKLFVQSSYNIVTIIVILLLVNTLWTLLHYPQYRRLLKFKHWLCIFLAGLGFLASCTGMVLLHLWCNISDFYAWLVPTIQHVCFNCYGYFRDKLRLSRL